MKGVLEQLNTVQEVIGSMVCTDRCKPLAFLFPPLFDERIIRSTCETLCDARTWDGSHSREGVMDLRYADGRIIVRKLERGFVLVLCTRSVNLPLLNISLNVACRRLNELMSQSLSPDAGHEPSPHSFEAAPAAGSPPNLLLVDELDSSTEAGKGFQELGMVAVTGATAHRLASLFSVNPLKRVRLTHEAGGTSGVFGLMVFADESGRYDGRIIISRHVERKLSAAKGDRLRVEPA